MRFQRCLKYQTKSEDSLDQAEPTIRYEFGAVRQAPNEEQNSRDDLKAACGEAPRHVSSRQIDEDGCHKSRDDA